VIRRHAALRVGQLLCSEAGLRACPAGPPKGSCSDAWDSSSGSFYDNGRYRQGAFWQISPKSLGRFAIGFSFRRRDPPPPPPGIAGWACWSARDLGDCAGLDPIFQILPTIPRPLVGCRCRLRGFPRVNPSGLFVIFITSLWGRSIIKKTTLGWGVAEHPRRNTANVAAVIQAAWWEDVLEDHPAVPPGPTSSRPAHRHRLSWLAIGRGPIFDADAAASASASSYGMRGNSRGHQRHLVAAGSTRIVGLRSTKLIATVGHSSRTAFAAPRVGVAWPQTTQVPERIRHWEASVRVRWRRRAGGHRPQHRPRGGVPCR